MRKSFWLPDFRRESEDEEEPQARRPRRGGREEGRGAPCLAPSGAKARSHAQTKVIQATVSPLGYRPIPRALFHRSVQAPDCQRTPTLLKGGNNGGEISLRGLVHPSSSKCEGPRRRDVGGMWRLIFGDKAGYSVMRLGIFLWGAAVAQNRINGSFACLDAFNGRWRRGIPASPPSPPPRTKTHRAFLCPPPSSWI